MKNSSRLKAIVFILTFIAYFVSMAAGFGQSTATVQLSKAKSAVPVTVTVVSEKCNCDRTFKDTRKFTKGARGGLFCMWTQKSGKVVKRYAAKL